MTAPRQEFPIAVKRAALERSGNQCEAVGVLYGLEPGVRCISEIDWGDVQFDHYPRGARDPSPETKTLGNCVACCPRCNQWKAHNVDVQIEWKIKDVQRKHGTIPDERKPKPKMRSRQFPKGPSRPIRSRGFGNRRPSK